MTPGAILTTSSLPVTSAGVIAPGRASASGPFAVPADDSRASGESAEGPAKATDEPKPDAAEDAATPEGDEPDQGGADEQSTDAALDAHVAAKAAMAAAAALAAQPLTIHTLNGLLLTVPAPASPGARAQAAARTGADAPADQRTASGPQPTRHADAHTTPQTPSTSADTAGQSARVGADTPQRDQPQQDPGTSNQSRDRAAADRPGPDRTGPQPMDRAVARPTPAGAPALASAAPVAEARTANPSSIVVGVRLGVVEGAGAARAAVAPRPGAFSAPPERTGPAQVVRGVLAAVNHKGGKVTLDLAPGELGKMRVELKLDARSAVATFHVESPEARRLLEEALPQLRQALTDRGLSLERAEVVVPGVELPGAAAAWQAGAHAVALVAPEDLDPRTPGQRDPQPRDPRDAPGHDARDAEHAGSSDDDPGPTPGRVAIIGPDGVDVVA